MFRRTRGKGVARVLMARLEDEAGIGQPEAIALYRRLGYVECEPFGAYKPDPLGQFMGKRPT